MTGHRAVYTSGMSTAGGGDWRHRARCRDTDASVFFSDAAAGSALRDGDDAEAKAICRRCPVVTACLQHALTTPERHGVWGGTTETEREAVLRGTHHIPDPRMRDAVRGVRVDRAAAIERIRSLAAVGESDAAIAAVLGTPWNRGKVADARNQAGIPAGRHARTMQTGRVA